MTKRYEGADGIRGFACLIVLLTHAPGFFFRDYAFLFSGTGKIGVWLFFVLSAFLLTSKFERTGFSLSEIASYAIGRFLRIIPLFLIAVFVYWVFGTANINSIEDVKKIIAFQQGYVHLWTIPVEFKFYGFLPIIAFLLISAKRLSGNVATSALTVAMILIHQIIWPHWDTPENSISTSWYFPSFILGCYAAVSMDAARKHITPKSASIVGAFVIISIICFTPGARRVLFDAPYDKWLMNQFVSLSLLWMLFIIFIADGKGAIGSIMQSIVLKRLGTWSYSIYLIHWLIYAKLSSIYPNSFVWAIIALLGAVASGAILYYVIEAPIEKFRRSIQIKHLVTIRPNVETKNS